MFNKLQIGTIAYKKDDEYKTNIPLYAEEIPELKENYENLQAVACEMLTNDLIEYILNNQKGEEYGRNIKK